MGILINLSKMCDAMEMEKRPMKSFGKSGLQTNTHTTENNAAIPLKTRYQITLRLSGERSPTNRIQKSKNANAIREKEIATRPIATNDSPIGVASQSKLFAPSTLR